MNLHCLYFQTLYVVQGTMRVSLLLVVLLATILLVQGKNYARLTVVSCAVSYNPVSTR